MSSSSNLIKKTTTNKEFNLIYKSHSNWPQSISKVSTSKLSSSSPPSINISVLDSSFNPPHKAHLKLSNPKSSISNSISNSITACLLVLSSKNADKGESKEGIDANVEQRLEMMKAMALEMESMKDEGSKNVGVLLINEFSFVGKSKLLKRELRNLLKESNGDDEVPEIRLCFSQGWDTLIRFFDPKYYQPPSDSITKALESFFLTDKSTIICARRGDISTKTEEEFLNSEHVKRWKDKIKLFNLDESIKGVSSTKIRNLIGEEEGEERSRKLGEVMLGSVLEIIDRDGLYRKKSKSAVL